MKYNKSALVVLALLAVNLAFGQVYERSRNETKSFRVYPQTSLEIVNKYGNINLFNWSKDSVRIEIKAEVKASKQQKADKLFEFIDFEFSDSKYYIVAKTQLRQNQGSFWAELSDLANTVFSGNNKIQVDYDVYLPADMELKLENKFGNIYCTNYQGNLSINLSNGDLKANDLTGDTDIAVSFGNASINTIKVATIELNYAELKLKTADELTIESKSSEIEIEKLSRLQINSRRDQLEIDEVDILSGETSFTYITLENLLTEIKLTSTYGDLNIQHIAPGFHKIEMDAKYTDIRFAFSGQPRAEVKVDYTETTGLYYPDSFSGLTHQEITEKDGRHLLSGKIGNPEANRQIISVSVQSGKVTLEESVFEIR